ncbi:MAG: ABC transporter permease [Spirochaetes bacterium]|nr:ABC transporter permease [Spirochaetota bacterium]
MYVRLLYNEVRKNPLVTFTSVLFVCAAALLVSLAAILTIHLAGAVDGMMTRGKTPHFMQMHAGTLDTGRMETFARSLEGVADFQVLEFLNLDGSKFIFSRADGTVKTLADSVQDNGLVVGSLRFDLLLDLDGKLIEPKDGEVYLPIAYIEEGLAATGDILTVAGRLLRIAGALRDSQMQSMLASSKRFLVSDTDFAALKSAGSIEYLIQFRLHDPDQLGAFAAEYAAAGLEANGPAVTYPLFRMMNGLSDGLMIALILLVSALVLAIAFLCIRFTLLAKIEDDYREIGVMKAIGLRVGDIKRIYLIQYLAIAAAGCLAGYLLSLLFLEALLANIRLYMGHSANGYLAPLLGGLSVILVFLAVLAYVNGVLNRFRKIAPAQAVRFGMAQDQKTAGRRFRLRNNSLLDTNLILGIKDVVSRKSLYATMLIVLALAAFIIIVPQNLHTTVSSPSFVTYMGIGQSDLYLGIQQTENIRLKTAELALYMERDPEVLDFVVMNTVNTRVFLPDGSEERLLVELGDHSVFPLVYNEGRAATALGSTAVRPELALSVLSASGLGVRTGDSITLLWDGQKTEFSVCGIYSDVTNGGRTAKAVYPNDSVDLMWSTVSVRLADNADRSSKVIEYSQKFPYAKVADIDEYFRQAFGHTADAIGKSVSVSIAVALSLALLIILLFMRLLVVKDRYPIAVMKAFGYTNSDIRRQYLARSLFVLVLGVLVGTVLANTAGEALAGALISSFGVATFRFVVNPIYAYILSPLALSVAVLAATVLGSLDAGRIHISDNIKEA